jgi:branched-chain amino acid transport system permease protein
VLNLAVAGLAAGGTYAAIGVCIVLLFRMAAVVNFSQTFGPTVAVFAMTDFLDIWGWSLWPSVLLALALGTLIPAAQGFALAKVFRESTVMIRSTVSMAMAIALFAVAVRIFHDTNRFFPALFSSLSGQIGDVRVSGQVIMAFFGAVVVSLALWALLRFTRIGVILRAVSNRPVTAELMGVRTTWLIVGVWALGGLITTAAIILVAPTRSSIPNMVTLVIPALAAAIFGNMRSFGLTVLGGVIIGMVESLALEWGTIGNYRPALSFLMVSAVLLWSQRKEMWSEAR